MEKSLFDFYNSIHWAKKNSQDNLNFKEALWKSLFLHFILISFHSSSQKTDCRNENSTSKLWKNSVFDFLYKYIHVAKNNSQDIFHSMENQRNTMKSNLSDFYNSIHDARNNSLIPFQSIEIQGNSMTSTVFFYFDECSLKLT